MIPFSRALVEGLDVEGTRLEGAGRIAAPMETEELGVHAIALRPSARTRVRMR